MTTQHEYRKLIGRLRLDALESPRRYRRRAFLVSFLGHGAVFAYFATCIALVVGGPLLVGRLPGTLLAAAGLALAALGLRTLQVELAPPAGQPVDRAAAPRLWALVDKLGRKLDAPAIDEIVIDEQCGVRILAFPRWIWFGPTRRVLVLGLPWLLSLSPKQAAAGICHAYARLGLRIGRRYTWLAHCRDFWPRYIEAQPGFINSRLQRAFAAYANYMDAYTLPLACELALRADQAAARHVGAERTAQVLVRSRVMERWLDTFFWPQFMREADEQPEPPTPPFQGMPTAFHATDRSIALRRCFLEEMGRKPQLEDAAPGIQDRLRALSQKPELTGMPLTTAAEHLLGDNLSLVIHALDLAWRQRELPFWRHRHETVQAARLWLQTCAPQDIEQLGVETLIEYARALLTVGERGRALALIEQAARHPQGKTETAWALARLVGEHDEVEALPYLDLVIERDAFHAVEAAELALGIAEKHGRRDRVGHYRRSLQERAA